MLDVFLEISLLNYGFYWFSSLHASPYIVENKVLEELTRSGSIDKENGKTTFWVRIILQTDGIEWGES